VGHEPLEAGEQERLAQAVAPKAPPRAEQFDPPFPVA
jgi:hypothetical protein